MDSSDTARAYVENNPVRAQRVRRAEDYVWSSARAEEFDAIRQATFAGRPLESKEFVVGLERQLKRKLTEYGGNVSSVPGFPGFLSLVSLNAISCMGSRLERRWIRHPCCEV